MAEKKWDWLEMDNIPSYLGSATDRFGNTIYFGNAGTCQLPPYFIGKDTTYASHMRAFRDMEIYEDDILICSFPKSGYHWHSEIISRLMNKTDEMQVDISPFMERSPFERVKDIKRPRLLATHAPFHLLPRQALEKKIKIVHVIRNPKDVLASYYHMLHGMKLPFAYRGTFEQFVTLLLENGFSFGDPFEHTICLQDGFDLHPEVPVFMSVYEDMIKDPIDGVKKLNEFLETGCDPQLCERIAFACSIQEVRTTKEEKQDKVFLKERSLFHNEHSGYYRKGEIGDWKNWFTVALNEEFDKEAEKRLTGCRIQFTYE